MAVFTTNFTVLSPASTDGTWTDYDVSAIVPVGTTGVMLWVWSAGEYTLGFRKNGSTDNRGFYASTSQQSFAFVGVDANRIFEYKRNNANCGFYLIGYVTTDAVLFDNATDKSFATTGSYQTVDCSDVIPVGGLAAIVEVQDAYSGGWHQFSVREYGSTDDRYGYGQGPCWFIIPLDSSRRFEAKISSTSVDFYVNGYFTVGQFNVNGTEVLQSGTTGVFYDSDRSGDSPPVGVSGAVVFTYYATSQVGAAVRNNGSTDAWNSFYVRNNCITVGMDTSKIFEYCKLASAKYYVLGYLVDPSVLQVVSPFPCFFK